MIIERDRDGQYWVARKRFLVKKQTRGWYVHDANKITDAQVRSGRRAPSIYASKELDGVFRYIQGLLDIEPEE